MNFNNEISIKLNDKNTYLTKLKDKIYKIENDNIDIYDEDIINLILNWMSNIQNNYYILLFSCKFLHTATHYFKKNDIYNRNSFFPLYTVIKYAHQIKAFSAIDYKININTVDELDISCNYYNCDNIKYNLNLKCNKNIEKNILYMKLNKKLFLPNEIWELIHDEF